MSLYRNMFVTDMAEQVKLSYSKPQLAVLRQSLHSPARFQNDFNSGSKVITYGNDL